jgi:hypothetical protein
MTKISTLDAKVQVKRLAIKYRELSDLPYKSAEEKKVEDDLISQIKTIVENTIFKNEIDQSDFDDYLEQQLGGHDFDLPDPVGTKKHDEQLSEELEEESIGRPLPTGEPIPQIKSLREQKKSVQEQIKELQSRKKDLKLLKQKSNLEKELEKMEDQIREEQKEEAFLTDKKDKDGIVKLRHDKYNKKMDELTWEKFTLEDMLEKAITKKDEEEIEKIKEALKINKSKRFKLKGVKVKTYFQNYMVKIPRWINKGTKAIGELGDGLSSMGEMGGGKGSKNSFANLQVGGNDDFDGDFGFNEKSMFGGMGTKSRDTPKTKKKSKKKPKKKKGKKK